MSALTEAVTQLPDEAAHRLASRIPVASQKAVNAVQKSVESNLFVSMLEWGRDPDKSDDAWANTYATTVRNGQRAIYEQSTELFTDYLSLSTGTPAVNPGGRLSGLLAVDTSDAWTYSPVSRYWHHISEGVHPPEAAIRAGSYAGQLGSLDVAHAQRHAIAAVDRANPGVMKGQRKVLSGDACGWCRVVADRMYRLTSKVPTHASDRCGVVPVVPGDGWQGGQLAKGQWEELLQTPATPSPSLVARDRVVAPAMTPAQVDKTRQRWLANSAKDVPLDQAQAMRLYTGSSYQLINNYLRTGRTTGDLVEIERLSNLLQESLEANLTPVPITVHRTVRNLDQFKHHPARPVTEASQIVGRTYTEKGFLSTSMSETATPGGVVNMTINVPPGTPARYVQEFSKYQEEREVLLGRDLRYFVREAKEDPVTGVWNLEIDVLPPEVT